MKIAIIGNEWNEEENYKRLCAVMEKLIADSQCYLFDVICGGTDKRVAFKSAGYRWAIENGAPVYFLLDDRVDKLIDKMVKEIDFAVIIKKKDSDDKIIREIIMKLSMNGKHGRVEEI